MTTPELLDRDPHPAVRVRLPDWHVRWLRDDWLGADWPRPAQSDRLHRVLDRIGAR